METKDLKAVGIVLKEKLTYINKRIDEQAGKVLEGNAALESGLLKQMDDIRLIVAEVEDKFVDLELVTREAPESLNVKIDDFISGVDLYITQNNDTLIDDIREQNDTNQAHIKAGFKVAQSELLLAIATARQDITSELLATIKGAPGVAGAAGERGERGEQGQQGDTGDQGEDGCHGLKGEIGPDGVDGIDGIDGADGIDGKDAGARASRKWTAGNECTNNDLLTHKGGLWRCTGATFSEPAIGDDRWVLITNGIDKVSAEQGAAYAGLFLTSTSGIEAQLVIDLPIPNHTNEVWKAETEYSLNDVVFKDRHSFIAQADNPAGEPGQSDDWAKFAMSGMKGRKGDRGPAGAVGAAGADGRDGPTDAKVKRFIDHILQADESDTPIRNSRGKWAMEDSYSVGDVVSMGSGLYLCIQAHAEKAPASDHQAGEYWRVLVPAAGVGIGGTSGSTATLSLDAYQAKAEKGANSGYAPLDANGKVPAANLPPSTALAHHIFATQADMLAGGAGIVAGENVLVHGDPAADNNGEYVALQDAPTTLAHYDHLGEHIAAHRHDGNDVDVTIAGHTETLTVGLTHMGDQLAGKLQTDGSIDAESLPLVSLNAGQQAHVKNDSLWLDETQTLKWKDNTGASVPVIASGVDFDVTLAAGGAMGQQPTKAEIIAVIKTSTGFQDTPAYWGSSHRYYVRTLPSHAPPGGFILFTITYYGQPANVSEATAGEFFVDHGSVIAEDTSAGSAT